MNRFPDTKKVFIIAEAGSNWKVGGPSKSFKTALNLIDAAEAAGADAVKFQTFRADGVYVQNAGMSDYLSKNGIRRSIVEIFKNVAMPYEMLPKLARHCRKKGLEFMSSFFSLDDFKAVDPWVRIHKIASYEITHPDLLALAGASGKPLILSTGASTLKEIDWAVDTFKKNNGKTLCLLQCTAKYPAPLGALNLRALTTLARRYRVPVGLSDHSEDPLVGPVAAVALGARVIEKHLTLDKKLPGPDQAFAVTPMEFEKMTRAIRSCEEALGTGKKNVLPEEKELFFYAQRALQARRDIRAGERLELGVNIDILRPGRQKKGLHPRFWEKMRGRRALKFIRAGRGILESDYAKKA